MSALANTHGLHHLFHSLLEVSKILSTRHNIPSLAEYHYAEHPSCGFTQTIFGDGYRAYRPQDKANPFVSQIPTNKSLPLRRKGAYASFHICGD